MRGERGEAFHTLASLGRQLARMQAALCAHSQVVRMTATSCVHLPAELGHIPCSGGPSTSPCRQPCTTLLLNFLSGPMGPAPPLSPTSIPPIRINPTSVPPIRISPTSVPAIRISPTSILPVRINPTSIPPKNQSHNEVGGLPPATCATYQFKRRL